MRSDRHCSPIYVNLFYPWCVKFRCKKIIADPSHPAFNIIFEEAIASYYVVKTQMHWEGS